MSRVPDAPYPRPRRTVWKVLPSVPATDLEETLNALEVAGWTINGAHMERGDASTFVVTATCYVDAGGHDHNRTGTVEQYRAILGARDAADDEASRLLYDASVSFWYHLPPSEQERANRTPVATTNSEVATPEDTGEQT